MDPDMNPADDTIVPAQDVDLDEAVVAAEPTEEDFSDEDKDEAADGEELVSDESEEM